LSSGTPLFALDDVHVTRGNAPVLTAVSCEIAAGATAIVGPSGAGKSTFLRLLNRLADPLRGTILLRGRDLRTL
jgi:putative ABC transport system ATP-binding protein